MKFVSLAMLASLAASALALPAHHGRGHHGGHHGHQGDVYKKHTIRAKGIEASFMEYGAIITNLWVKDKTDTYRDIVLGWDDTTQYNLNAQHPYFGPIVGRYANRIKNGTFTLDNQTYHIPLNEKGFDTLHGGDVGFDRRNWTVVDKADHSITFAMHSPDGDQGFPGNVDVKVKYTLTDDQEWAVDYEATTDKDTPIMLSAHTYWNLDAFTTSDTAFDQVVQIKADKYIDTDGYLIPTGDFVNVDGTPQDFRLPKAIGKDLHQSKSCGDNCTGYDNAWVLSHPSPDEPQMSVYAPSTGIAVDITTDQVAMQLYTCNGLDGTIPVKKTQTYHGKQQFVQQYGCYVIEAENYIDGINNPQWGEEHTGIVRKGETYTQHTKYHFSVKK
ncbi:galactose mutarotase-like domain-containing protein [Gongronella butleri]|nr:galactose mutarotase-like domain-containing protein [Gongronella butleri]